MPLFLLTRSLFSLPPRCCCCCCCCCRAARCRRSHSWPSLPPLLRTLPQLLLLLRLLLLQSLLPLLQLRQLGQLLKLALPALPLPVVLELGVRLPPLMLLLLLLQLLQLRCRAMIGSTLLLEPRPPLGARLLLVPFVGDATAGPRLILVRVVRRRRPLLRQRHVVGVVVQREQGLLQLSSALVCFRVVGAVLPLEELLMLLLLLPRLLLVHAVLQNLANLISEGGERQLFLLPKRHASAPSRPRRKGALRQPMNTGAVSNAATSSSAAAAAPASDVGVVAAGRRR